MTSRLDRVEIAAGMVLTGLAIYLRIIAFVSAGALWRDEANTVGLATLPRLRDVWSNLQFDSFPMLWLLIVRGFAAATGTYNDFAFRTLGFVIGLALIAALWINARALGYRVPLVALAFFAVSPSVIVWGDSMRAYGLAMLLIFLTGTLIWRFIENPTGTRFTAAAVVALLCVQTVYYNSVVLLALCAGGVAACSLRRRWNTAMAVVGIGAIAAVSIIPYTVTIHAASSWNSLVKIPDYSTEWFFVKLYECLLPGGSWTFTAWISAATAATLAALVAVLQPARFDLSEKSREITLFALVSLLVGSIGSFLFLRVLSYYTQPWYYLTLLTIAAFSIDVLIGLVTIIDRRIVRLVTVLAMGTGTFLVGRKEVRQRLTNADLVARRIEQVRKPGDLVIVDPWYYGVSFDRYYREAAWRTVPDISFHRFHRYDLVMTAMHGPESSAVDTVIAEAQAALRRGNTVFVVGAFSAPHGELPSTTPVGGDQAMQDKWMSVVHDSLAQAATIRDLPIASPSRVSGYENLRVTALRDSPLPNVSTAR